MHSSKEPNPYDKSNFFYLNFWHIIGDDDVEYVLSILNSSHMLKKDKLADFRPVSICNVIISDLKSLSKQVKVYSSIPCFTPKVHFYNHNITVDFEVLNSLRTKRIGKQGQVVLKLNMKKAYNWVEQGLMEKFMHKLGFDRVDSAHYGECEIIVQLVLLKWGEQSIYTTIQRDQARRPLPPYLLLLCVKGCQTY